MAFFDTTWYVNFGDGSTTGYFALTKRPQNTAVAAGIVRRQFTVPATASLRAFVCIIAGTTADVTDATWTLTRGARSTDGTATWQECTGASAVNGDLTNTPNWTTVKQAVITLGQIIKRNNGASYHICSVAGTGAASSEPAFSDTAGTTVTDGAVWTSLGAVGNFTGGMAPHASLTGASASTWAANGNTIYMGDNSAETYAAATSFTGGVNVGPVSNPLKILCHNHSGSYPPASTDLTTGASVSTTGASSTLTLNYIAAYFRGIKFTAGNSTNAAFLTIGGAATHEYIFDTCVLELGGSTSSNLLKIGDTTNTSSIRCILDNTTVKFAATGHTMSMAVANFAWVNTSGGILASGSSVPTSLMLPSTAGCSNIITFEGCDLSQLTGNIFAANGSSTVTVGVFAIKDCKLNVSTTIVTSGAPLIPGLNFEVVRCDNGTKSYRSERHNYQADETTETSVTRVGGATDQAGNLTSRKIVTTGNTFWFAPYTMETLAIWNTTVLGNVTVTVEGTINSAALPNNDDIWIEIEYLGSTLTPLGTFDRTNTKSNILATNGTQTSSASSWNGGGSGAGWSPFKMSVILSSPQPGLAGYIFVRVKAAKASTTYYIDPQITLS